MSDLTGGESVILFGAIIVVLGFIMLCATTASPRRPDPPAMMPLAPPPVEPTADEVAAIQTARTIGQPVDFVQSHPITGQPALFRATVMSDGRALISLVPQNPGPGGTTTKWIGG